MSHEGRSGTEEYQPSTPQEGLVELLGILRGELIQLEKTYDENEQMPGGAKVEDGKIQRHREDRLNYLNGRKDAFNEIRDQLESILRSLKSTQFNQRNQVR